MLPIRGCSTSFTRKNELWCVKRLHVYSAEIIIKRSFRATNVSTQHSRDLRTIDKSNDMPTTNVSSQSPTERLVEAGRRRVHFCGWQWICVSCWRRYEGCKLKSSHNTAVESWIRIPSSRVFIDTARHVPISWFAFVANIMYLSFHMKAKLSILGAYCNKYWCHKNFNSTDITQHSHMYILLFFHFFKCVYKKHFT
jgi:hypothetical protein